MDMQSIREWFVEHKLRAVGTLWASSLLGSFAYNFAQPGVKMSVKLIHARLHAQFLTLAALAGSAAVEAYDQQVGEKAKRYEKHIQTNVN
ncbi:uncharacterized protein [Physcomitrium patens]|uniref:HIG1 domain-containing protein n=1 Tax=Physcomitrium patens TaxID=3218 RepID=A9RI82_PHYPA|nr:respiratory supercomplex factor 2, mitochondrial-like [Physcomitrium patens]PNR29099.1 hypothetical protein PHYPA_027791 [Physcomitrium patens]|eukprot:XP_024361944.1 respiratory supercomplex factor 2, mitochondrial-like [Physcomitrella patens]